MSLVESPHGPRWVVNPRDKAAEAQLMRELKIPSIVAAVLVQRGLTDPALAHAFLNPSLDQLHDPRRLPDYASARDVILAAKESGELIYVHGDYDVDGVTSAAIFNRYLSKIGCKVHTHVPHRMKEGYGIHLNAVEEARAMGAKVFLTCDCGVAAHDQVEAAREAGMKVVVTDHHSIGDELPSAQAVVNPHRTDCDYPFAELSGAGVAFKLCAGLTTELGHPLQGYYRAFLDLAALGTIADVMPLIDENRVIARFGLVHLAETKKVGLQALMREAKVVPEPGKPLRSRHVGWQLGPRLNAAGRIDDAALALQLLIENNVEAADAIAAEMEAINTQRRSQTVQIVESAAEQVERLGMDQKNVIMVADPSWHAGIVGIVAGRLVQRYNRPAFVLTINEETGIAKGSARTIPNFHLADAIRAHPELMDGGGHAMAAGCSFPVERLDAVREALDSYAGKFLTPEDFVPTLFADLEVESDEITLSSLESLNTLEPFGCENPEPTFVAKHVKFAQIMPTKSPAHVRVTLRQGEHPAISGIAFNIGERVTEAGVGAEVDLLFEPGINEFRGSRTVQWQVKEFAPAE